MMISGIKRSAGLIIIKDNKILLGHPTNRKESNSYSFPKGGIEVGESKLDAAIRETHEEVGILIPDKIIDKTEYEIKYLNKKNVHYKSVYYFIVNVPSEYFDFNIVPTEQLQLEEIDYALFLNKEEAEHKIFWRFIPVLKHLKNDKKDDK